MQRVLAAAILSLLIVAGSVLAFASPAEADARSDVDAYVAETRATAEADILATLNSILAQVATALVPIPLPSPPTAAVIPQAASSPESVIEPAVELIENSSDILDALADCESGGNPSTNTGNGYYGAFQFLPSTWRGVGGSGMPQNATYEEQKHRAGLLIDQLGWGQFPGCARELGML